MYKILLVEDDKALRFVYSKMKVWSECGFVISKEATDGKMALEILQNNSFDLIIMEDITLSLNLNKDYFGKLFKQHTNVTFNHFYSIVKVEYSKELLSTGNYTIYQVSELLGYSSVDYFTKIFKEITGETPSKFKIN